MLPAFVLGLVMSRHYAEHREEQKRLRVAWPFASSASTIKTSRHANTSLISGSMTRSP